MVKNYIRDTIITGFEVTRMTNNKVPMLLLSNPGIAKTTIVGEIAAHEGYEVVSLIGSGFENNEILGFQVNEPDWDYLITKNPTWFNTILENKKNNKPSILFIDEISVCPSLVQGALYRLIFERTIGNGRKLPEDCVIISAGNYKSNLPSYCDITAPALNRFCIINLESPDFHSFLDEFSQNEEERMADWPEFNHDANRLGPNIWNNATKEVKTMMEEVFECYSDSRDNSKGYLDIRNKDFAACFEGTYSRHGQVYNFISGRTYYYLQQSVAACALLNVPLNGAKNPFIDRMVEGLIGAGTATFNDANQCEAFIKSVTEKVRQMLKRLKSGEAPVTGGENIFDGATEIADKVDRLSLYLDGTRTNVMDTRRALGEIYTQAMDVYDKDPHQFLDANLGENVPEDKRKINYAKFVADISALETLVKICDTLPQNSEVEVAKNGLTKIVQNYSFYAEVNA